MKLPPILWEAIQGYTRAKVHSGESGREVYRFTRKGRRARSLNHGSSRTGR